MGEGALEFSTLSGRLWGGAPTAVQRIAGQRRRI